MRFPEMPTPSPLPGSAKLPGAAVFGEPQPTRAASASLPPTRPALARVPTPNDSELRGFGDQRTPSGFGEQRTPSSQRTPGFGDQRTPSGFGEQRTPSGQRTPTDPGTSRTPTGNPVPSRVSTDNVASAEEAFRRGELAMKRDQPGEAVLEFKTACDLNPNEVDYAAMLAWAKFCAAGDKPAIGADTRKALERAIYKSNKPERARFYLGRVERMLGRDKEALRQFQEVLDLKPNHADAASEIRAIEARLHASGKTGLFGRKR
jgi:tetratricopeptide (TPR) repeat protein